ncbi:MAG: GNAT family N-acetyltransferase [Gaiellales bacterium]|nr:GNAT family N-acetyltransferase [Gaiellales bacterium]
MEAWAEPPVVRAGRLRVRPAREGDAALLAALVGELASFERLSQECTVTASALSRWLFGPPHRVAEAVVLEWDGLPAGFALFFHTFSTFLARPTLYLEDLFVRPAFRRNGIGREALIYLARLAQARDCGRLEWSVLDWNSPAHEFYLSLGARPLEEWTMWRVAGPALARLAGQG